MRTLVTGATGFIGRRLLEELDGPVVLSRSAERARRSLSEGDVTTFSWNPTAERPPGEAFEGVDVVVHLAGEPIGMGRWDDAKRRRIRESRVLGTRHLVEAMTERTPPPPVLISSSAIGYYGSRGDDVLEETEPPGKDFLAQVCLDWEREAARAADFGVRVVRLRSGIVLGPDGGALEEMVTPFRFGVGAVLGDGSQWMPWVHLDDVVGLILFAAAREEVEGPLNVTAPHPVTNREFTRALAKVLNRPSFLQAPAFALRLLFGEFAESLLASIRAVPRAALHAGYEFQYSDLESALRASLGQS